LILDAGRAVVDALPERVLKNLRGGHATCDFAWNTMGIPAGDYEAQLHLLSSSGDLLARSTLYLRLGRAAGQIEGITLSPGGFRVGDEIEMTAIFTNTGSEPLDGTITLVVRDASGAVADTFSGVFSNLLPSTSASFTQRWSSTLSPRDCEIVAYASFRGETTPLWVSRSWEDAPLLIDIERSDAGPPHVRWPSVSNRTYVVEACTNLNNQVFTPLAPPPLTTPPENRYTDSVDRIHGVYRVREMVP
jgi:hypothetical protein